MNPLIRKEIRLVLPAWLAVLFLEMALPWIVGDQYAAITYAPCYFFFGMVLLAVDSFGREFSLGTFSALMAQPLERRQVWRTKLAVLLAAAALIFAAYFLSCALRLHGPVGENEMRFDPKGFASVMVASGAVLLVALTGGLWTALLLRQISAALWIAWLAPVGLLLSVIFVASLIVKAPSNLADDLMLYGAAGVYVVFAFWLAHRLFFRAEDAGWTGGVVSLSRWRYFERSGQDQISQRTPRSLAALVRKEFQLQSVSLLFAAALLGLHVVVFLLRVYYSQFHQNSLAAVATDCFWLLWLLLPLVIGCMAVAEERKLGVMEEQFCLPMARRRQFSVKLAFALVWGVLLGGVMPLLLETAARGLGAPAEFFKNQNDFPELVLTVLALAAGLSWAGFYASTLARNFMQALTVAPLVCVGGGLGIAFLNHLGELVSYGQGQQVMILGLVPASWGLILLIGLPTLAGVWAWLTYRNFNQYQEGGRLWRRDFAGLLGVVLFTGTASAVIYQRPWEIFTPAEPAHGAATFSPANPPSLQSDASHNGLLVHLPDGRVWCGSLGYYYFLGESASLREMLWTTLVHPLPESGGPQAFIGGSNWVSASVSPVRFWDGTETTGYRDTVAIRSDGTLWLAGEARPGVWTGAEMKPFGTETNWRQIVRKNNGFLLLKTDGTLWQWGITNETDYHQWRTNWPTVRGFQPQQIGTDTGWQKFFQAPGDYIRKADGSVWSVRWEGKDEHPELERETNLETVASASISRCGESRLARVSLDGTLWLANVQEDRTGWRVVGWLPLGGETNWTAVTVSWDRLVALKADGSLWQWKIPFPGNDSNFSLAEVAKQPPTRLGIHGDWVGLASYWGGAVTLAADGSLWFWPDPQDEGSTWLKLPKQPEWLGNVLARNSGP